MEHFCLYSLVSMVLVAKAENIGESVVTFSSSRRPSTLPVVSLTLLCCSDCILKRTGTFSLW